MSVEDNNEYVLDIHDLSIHYVLDRETVEAVNHIDMQITPGEVVGLVGETGAGKTTTALSVLGLVPNPPGKIINGYIKVGGKNIIEASPKELEALRGDFVSMIFQDPMTSLNPVFTVGQQIAESIKLHNPVSEKEAFEKACEMLEMVGISRERAYEYPHQFTYV